MATNVEQAPSITPEDYGPSVAPQTPAPEVAPPTSPAPSGLSGSLGTTSMKDALSFARPIVNEMQQPINDSLKRQATDRTQLAKAQGEELQATQAAKLEEANATDKAYTQFKDVNAKDVADFKARLESTPLPAFVPTKDTVQDLAGVFSLIGILGTALGKGSGHGQAMASLSAMTGMLKGWQEGRHDLYEKEKAEFEKNFNLVKSQHEEFYKELLQAQKLAQNDLAAGTAMAHNAAVKFGSPIVAAQIKQRGLQAGIDSETEIMKSTDAANKLVIGLAGKELDRQAKLGAPIPDQTLTSMAEQYLAGDKSVIQGLGYGTTGAGNRIALRNRIEEIGKSRGMTGKDIATSIAEFTALTAAERTLGTQSARIDYAIANLQQFVPIAVNLSNKMDRTDYPTLNSAINAVSKGAGDENMVRFIAAHNAVVSDYSAVIGRGNAQTTDLARHMAQDVLSTAYSQGQYAAAADQLMIEANAALQGTQTAKDRLAGREPQKKSYSAGDIIDRGRKKYRVTGGDPNDPDVEEVK